MLTEITNRLTAAVERQRGATEKPREQELADFKARFAEDLAAADAALLAYTTTAAELRPALVTWQRDLAALDPGCHRDLDRARQLVGEALGLLGNVETLRTTADRIRRMTVDTYFSTVRVYLGWEEEMHRSLARLLAGPAAARERVTQARPLVVTILAALDTGEIRPASSLRTSPAPPPPPQRRARTTLDDPA